MRFFLYALALEENTHVAPHCAVFEGDEPPAELTLQQMGKAWLGDIMPIHRQKNAEKIAAMDDNQLHDYLCSECPAFTHGVWIAEALHQRLDFMAAELEDFPTANDSELYSFGGLWANTLKKYAYRGQTIPFPELDFN